MIKKDVKVPLQEVELVGTSSSNRLRRGKETKLKGEWIGSCQVNSVEISSTLLLTLELVTSTKLHSLELLNRFQRIIKQRENILLNQNNINMLMRYIKDDNNNYM